MKNKSVQIPEESFSDLVVLVEYMSPKKDALNETLRRVFKLLFKESSLKKEFLEHYEERIGLCDSLGHAKSYLKLVEENLGVKQSELRCFLKTLKKEDFGG